MPRRSKIELLPAEIKAWLDEALVENNFSEYRLLSDELRARGHEISKTSVHEYGQLFEERLRALKLVSEQARAVVQAAPDDDGAVNDALVRLTQEKMFGILMEINVDPDTVDLAKLARAVAELGKASVAQKRWQVEARKQALEDAARVAGAAAKSAGLSAQSVDALKREILGIAS
jgi:hypothetical protein